MHVLIGPPGASLEASIDRPGHAEQQLPAQTVGIALDGGDFRALSALPGHTLWT
jgi:hypothetical protein